MGYMKVERKTDNVVTLDTNGIAARYNVGISTARLIGKESGARIKIGKRLLYLVEKTDAYIAKMNEETEGKEA